MENEIINQYIFNKGANITLVFNSGIEYKGVLDSMSSDSITIVYNSYKIKFGNNELKDLKTISLTCKNREKTQEDPIEGTNDFLPLPLPEEGYLPAMGRICKMFPHNGEIADVNSHLRLFFHRDQLLEDELYSNNNQSLIGQPVLYFVKRALNHEGFEARAIIRPMQIERAIMLGKQISAQMPLNAWGVFQVINRHVPNNAIVKDCIFHLLQNAYVREKMWKYEELPIHKPDIYAQETKASRKKEKEKLSPVAFVVTFTGKRGQVQSLGGMLYSFSISDIIEDGLIQVLNRIYLRNRAPQQIPVVCSFDEYYKKANLLHRITDISTYAELIKRKIRVRDFKIARGMLDIALLQFPTNRHLISSDSQLREFAELNTRTHKLDADSLTPCGVVLNTPIKLDDQNRIRNKKTKFDITKARISDSFFLHKIKYDPSDIIHSQLKNGENFEGMQMVYQLVKMTQSPNEKVEYFAKFITPCMSSEKMLQLASDLWEKKEYLKAWGVCKNILDQCVNHEEALALLRLCENTIGFEKIETVDLYNNYYYALDCINKGKYKEAIDLMQSALNNGLVPSLAIRHVMECYTNLISQTNNTKEKKQVQNQYLLFAEKYLENLDSSNEENLYFKTNFYSEQGNHAQAIRIYQDQLQFLSEIRNNERIADIYAGIAKEYYLMDNPNKEKEIEQNLNFSLKINPYCSTAVYCKSSYDIYNQVQTGEILRHNIFAPFNIAIFLNNATINNLLKKPNHETMEEERLCILYELSTCHNAKKAVQLLDQYLNTYLCFSISEYLEISKRSFVKSLYSLTENIIVCLENNNDLLFELQLASILSPLASGILSEILLKVDSAYAFTFVEGAQSDKEYYTKFAERRTSCFNSFNLVIKKLDSIQIQSSLSSCIEFLKDINFDIWNTRSDFSLLQDIKTNLVLILDAYCKSESTYDINNRFKQINGYIAEKLDLINMQPTVLKAAFAAPLLVKIRGIVNNRQKLVHFSKPKPEIKLVSSSAIDEIGRVILEFMVTNTESGSFPMKTLLLTLEECDSYTVEEKNGITKNIDLYGNDYTIFIFHVRLNPIGSQKNQIPCCLHLSYYADDQACSLIKQEAFSVRNDYYNWIGKNPYSNFGKRVEDERMFFGRENYINEIIGTICPNDSDKDQPLPARLYMLYGQKRSGKSSILYHTKVKLENDPRVFCVGVNFLNIDSQSRCYYKILNAISLKLADIEDEETELSFDAPKLNLPPDFQCSDCIITFQLFQNIIIGFKRSMRLSKNELWRNKQLVVLIDEFSSVYNAIKNPDNSIDGQFMENWRVLQEDKSSEFSSILICQDVMHTFMRDYGNYNVFSIFTPKRLTYLDRAYAEKLIIMPVFEKLKDPYFYLDGAVERILYYTACSAYYTVIFCYALLNYLSRNRLSHVTIEDVDIVAKEVVASEIIKKDRFDALLLAGEHNRVSSFSKEEVQSVVDQIAKYEVENSIGCTTSILKREVYDSNTSDSEYIESIIQDLDERKVIIKNESHLVLNIKLYLLWYQANKM